MTIYPTRRGAIRPLRTPKKGDSLMFVKSSELLIMIIMFVVVTVIFCDDDDVLWWHLSWW